VEKHVIMIGPIQAVWDDGAFAAPLFKPLSDLGYIVTCLDSMQFAAVNDVDKLADDIAMAIAAVTPVPSLIGGHAFGGLAAICMAERFPFAAILGLSAPVETDHDLREQLTAICTLLDDGMPAHAMDMLHKLVKFSGRDGDVDLQTAQDMSRMFKYLIALASRSFMPLQNPKALFLYGTESAMVTSKHIPASLQRYARSVPDAGMRLLNDASAVTVDIILNWIQER